MPQHLYKKMPHALHQMQTLLHEDKLHGNLYKKSQIIPPNNLWHDIWSTYFCLLKILGHAAYLKIHLYAEKVYDISYKTLWNFPQKVFRHDIGYRSFYPLNKPGHESFHLQILYR